MWTTVVVHDLVSPMASWVPIRAWHATNSVPVSVRAVIVTESAGEVVVMVRVNVKVPPGSSKTVGGHGLLCQGH